MFETYTETARRTIFFALAAAQRIAEAPADHPVITIASQTPDGSFAIPLSRPAEAGATSAILRKGWRGVEEFARQRLFSLPR